MHLQERSGLLHLKKCHPKQMMVPKNPEAVHKYLSAAHPYLKLRFIVYQKTELLVRDRSVNFPAVLNDFHGVVPKWLKGAVCKTVIRRFESGRRLSKFNG